MRARGKGKGKGKGKALDRDASATAVTLVRVEPARRRPPVVVLVRLSLEVAEHVEPLGFLLLRRLLRTLDLGLGAAGALSTRIATPFALITVPTLSF